MEAEKQRFDNANEIPHICQTNWGNPQYEIDTGRDFNLLEYSLFYKRTDIFDYLWSLVKNDQTNIDNCLLKNSRDLRITNLLHSYLKYIPDYPEKLVTPNNSTLTDLINNIVVSGNADSDILGNTYAHIILLLFYITLLYVPLEITCIIND